MTHIDTGLVDPKEARARVAGTNPSELLISLRHRYLDETRDEIISRFIDAAMANEAVNMAIIKDWASLNFRRLTSPAPTPEDRSKARTETARTNEELKERTKRAIKETMVKIVLLDMVMPNGKKLRDCTGAECLKSGGWLAAVGKKVGSKKIVGKVLSEKELRELWK